MLLQFKFGNFRSFKDVATLSMVASKDKEFQNSHVLKFSDKINAIRSAAIYGANASGKSNLIQAIAFMKHFVLTSSKETVSSKESIDVEPFLLNIEPEKEPSTFEIVFTIDKDQFRYGFQVDSKKVINEWLYFIAEGKNRESLLFIRENTNNFDIKPAFQGAAKIKKELTVKENILFLSLCSQLGVALANKIVSMFFFNLKVISGAEPMGYIDFTKKMMNEKEYLAFFIEFLQKTGTGIKGLERKESKYKENELPSVLNDDTKSKLMNQSKIDVFTKHNLFDNNGTVVGEVSFNMENQESDGTHQLFCLAGPLFDTIKNNRIMIVDEFSTKLHPKLARAIIDFFHSIGKGEDFSNSESQIIIVTHNTNIMTNRSFRRDQIYFVDKNHKESSILYSLADFKLGKPRKDASFNKDYIAGKYGAIPSIGSLDDLKELINGK